MAGRSRPAMMIRHKNKRFPRAAHREMNMPLRKKPVAQGIVRESDIITALARSNRPVTLEMLASWRRRGLLPAFDRMRATRERVFFWKDSEIIDRAKYVYDALSQGRPLGEIYIGLWIAGFDVPHHIFRRSWRNWLRTQNRWKFNPATRQAAGAPPCAEFETSVLQLLTKGLATVEGFSNFEIALNRITRILVADPQPLRSETLLLLHSLTLAFERSDLLENTSDKALGRAQGYLVNVLAALNSSAAWGEGACALPSVWPVPLSIQIGSPLLWMILSLMHSGHEERLASSNTVLNELTKLFQTSGPKPGKDEEPLREVRARLAELWRPLLCCGGHIIGVAQTAKAILAAV